MSATVRLRRRERAALLAHFAGLGADDRRLRFGSGIADDGIEAYVRRIDFEHDGVFAVHDDALHVVAAVHVASVGDGKAELGLSVLPGWRGRGLGDALLKRAVTFLRNRHVREVFVHCLSENAAMMHLARKNGMRIEYSGGESDARLVLPAPTVYSFLSEWMDDQRGGAVKALRQYALVAKMGSGLFFGSAKN